MAEDSSFKRKTPKRSVKPIVIILLFIAIFIPATVFAVMYMVEIRTKALPTENPQKIEVTNIMDTSATLSWVTPSQKTVGYIKYGNTSDLNNVVFDKRDKDSANGEYSLHYVDITDLTANTVYYYVIVVGGKEYKKSDGEFYQFKTGSVIDTVTIPQPIKGTIEDSSGQGGEVIIYLYAQNGNNTSNKISTLTSDNRYTLDLANLRMSDLSGSFTDLDRATLYVFAEGAERGEGNVRTEIVQLND